VRERSHVRILFTPDGEVEQFRLTGCEATRDADRRGFQAMMLAPDIDTCRALLRGERVPRSKLRPEWRGRFYLNS
jgi:hypothetical protein